MMRDIGLESLTWLVLTTIPFLAVACATADSEPDSPDEHASASPKTPTTVESKPLPTLNESAGAYFSLTFEQAQQLVPFDLVMPDPLPPEVDFVDASVHLPPAPPPPEGTAYPPDEAKWGTPREVAIQFQPSTGDEQSIALLEGELNHCSDGSGTSLTIDETPVTKQIHDVDDETLVVYCWDTHGLHFAIQALIGPQRPVSEEVLEQLIAASL